MNANNSPFGGSGGGGTATGFGSAGSGFGIPVATTTTTTAGAVPASPRLEEGLERREEEEQADLDR